MSGVEDEKVTLDDFDTWIRRQSPPVRDMFDSMTDDEMVWAYKSFVSAVQRQDLLGFKAAVNRRVWRWKQQQTRKLTKGAAKFRLQDGVKK